MSPGPTPSAASLPGWIGRLAALFGLVPAAAAIEPSEDEAMMDRCLQLARETAGAGELPFACLVAREGALIAQSGNRVSRERDLTRHAELVAISLAQKALGGRKLYGCTVYSSVEPCPMCAFALREAGVARVVYALHSPVMGGNSRWNVLGDAELRRQMPEFFGPPPEIVAGLRAEQAATVWRRARPIVWSIIALRGLFKTRKD